MVMSSARLSSHLTDELLPHVVTSHSLAPGLPVHRVPRSELRRLFKRHQFYHRLMPGELQAKVSRSYAAPPSAGQTPGTVAQIVAYLEGGIVVAAVHQYVRPRTVHLGASGLPDPIGVVVEGVVYLQERSLSVERLGLRFDEAEAVDGQIAARGVLLEGDHAPGSWPPPGGENRCLARRTVSRSRSVVSAICTRTSSAARSPRLVISAGR